MTKVLKRIEFLPDITGGGGGVKVLLFFLLLGLENRCNIIGIHL